MNELIFPPENTIGVMFNLSTHMPYVLFTISVNDNNYTGVVQTI